MPAWPRRATSKAGRPATRRRWIGTTTTTSSAPHAATSWSSRTSASRNFKIGRPRNTASPSPPTSSTCTASAPPATRAHKPPTSSVSHFPRDRNVLLVPATVENENHNRYQRCPRAGPRSRCAGGPAFDDPGLQIRDPARRQPRARDLERRRREAGGGLLHRHRHHAGGAGVRPDRPLGRGPLPRVRAVPTRAVQVRFLAAGDALPALREERAPRGSVALLRVGAARRLQRALGDGGEADFGKGLRTVRPGGKPGRGAEALPRRRRAPLGDRLRRPLRGGPSAAARRRVLDHPGDRERPDRGVLLRAPVRLLGEQPRLGAAGRGIRRRRHRRRDLRALRPRVQPVKAAALLMGLLLAACGSMPSRPLTEEERTYRSKCTSCHRAHEPSERSDWPQVLDRMQAEKKTHLTSEERASILQFLQGNMPPADGGTGK